MENYQAFSHLLSQSPLCAVSVLPPIFSMDPQSKPQYLTAGQGDKTCAEKGFILHSYTVIYSYRRYTFPKGLNYISRSTAFSREDEEQIQADKTLIFKLCVCICNHLLSSSSPEANLPSHSKDCSSEVTPSSRSKDCKDD